MLMLDCIPCAGSAHGDVYYTIRRNGKSVLDHRQALADHLSKSYQEVGPVVRHMCNNRGCRNVKHLAEGTHADNKQDSIVAGTAKFGVYLGEDNPSSKLSKEDVDYIRNYCADGRRGCQADMHRKYNVSRDCISKLVLNKSWRDDKTEADA